ncbi:MAG: efflux RND transporter periplasmic adaptor subunit, partial [Planctomycetia bacterium]|nr:efflux RND transporter periplasmic adaptor subunit [Planctomycetia bacterium]
GASIALSVTARRNLRLEYARIEAGNFEQTTPVPGMIVERPGRSMYVVSAPMTGLVERIYPIEGETVAPGSPLFDLRMTHEDLVVAQTSYLETILSLEVVEREVERLRKVAEAGAVAGRTLLEQQYQLEKLRGMMRAQRQQLLLHGLSDAQIDQISQSRSLISTLTIPTPAPRSPESTPATGSSETGSSAGTETSAELEEITGTAEFWLVSRLQVSPGQHVQAGETLAQLSDASVLYVEGRTFEPDIPLLERMFRDRTLFSAVPEARDPEEGEDQNLISGLTLASLADRVDPTSR